MNKVTVLLSAALASVAFSASSYAASCDKCVTEKSVTKLPALVHVVAPTDLPRAFERANVAVEVILDENGVPQQVKAAGPMARELRARLLPAVSQWRFSPKYVDGKAVPSRIILPLHLNAEV